MPNSLVFPLDCRLRLPRRVAVERDGLLDSPGDPLAETGDGCRDGGLWGLGDDLGVGALPGEGGGRNPEVVGLVLETVI